MACGVPKYSLVGTGKCENRWQMSAVEADDSDWDWEPPSEDEMPREDEMPSEDETPAEDETSGSRARCVPGLGLGRLTICRGRDQRFAPAVCPGWGWAACSSADCSGACTPGLGRTERAGSAHCEGAGADRPHIAITADVHADGLADSRWIECAAAASPDNEVGRDAGTRRGVDMGAVLARVSEMVGRSSASPVVPVPPPRRASVAEDARHHGASSDKVPRARRSSALWFRLRCVRT